MSYKEKIDAAIQSGKKLTLRSYLLRERGEEILRYMVTAAMTHVGFEDLAGPIHAAARELVQNASKASLKRILFRELELDPANPQDYEKGIQEFRKYLVESKISHYRERIAGKGLFFTASLEWNEAALLITVKNFNALLEVEDRRIREKFTFARTLDNLYDFYIQHGDVTEGAGMGIAMVEILLEEAGVDRHNFTIYSDIEEDATIARIIFPLSKSYLSPRERFERELEKGEYSREELRELVRRGEISLPVME